MAASVHNLEIERKFLLPRNFNVAGVLATKRIQAVKKNIVQTYLKTSKTLAPSLKDAYSECRVREVYEDDNVSYWFTAKNYVGQGMCQEYEVPISKDEYDTLLNENKDSAARTIRKTRYAFRYKGHTIEVDEYLSHKNLVTAEVELDDISEHVEIPDFIPIIREITGDRLFSNYQLALAPIK